jgi:hypothetical protein
VHGVTHGFFERVFVFAAGHHLDVG